MLKRRMAIPALALGIGCALFAAGTATSEPVAERSLEALRNRLSAGGTAVGVRADDFFGNYLRPEYLLPVFPFDGPSWGGDLSAVYDQLLVPVVPGFELLIVGEFPIARYFAFTIYDDHGATIDHLYDAQIEPLFEGDGNPYQVGGPPHREGRFYGLRVRLLDPLGQSPVQGCQTDPFQLDANSLDAHLRHSALDRYSDHQVDFTATHPTGSPTVVHDDSPNNEGLWLFLRRYLSAEESSAEESHGGRSPYVVPLAFLRDPATGCAYDLFELTGETQENPEDRLKQSQWFQHAEILDLEQSSAHQWHELETPILFPYGLDPLNGVAWQGSAEYVIGALPDTGYVSATVPSYADPERLNDEERVMRLRFRVPTVPCDEEVCSVTGEEELRYWAISFVGDEGTVATFSDLDMVRDPEGWVSLVVSFGTPLPPFVNPTNGYTAATFSPLPLKHMTLRNLLPHLDFVCELGNLPFQRGEHHPRGGYLGDYAPWVDFPLATDLPTTFEPPDPTGSCLWLPAGGGDPSGGEARSAPRSVLRRRR